MNPTPIISDPRNTDPRNTEVPGSGAKIAVPEFSAVPLTIAGVFDEAFDLYKRHFSLVALISAAVMAPVFLLGYAVDVFWLHPLQASLNSADPDMGGQLLSLLGTLFIGNPSRGWHGALSLCARVLVSAPIAVAVSDLYIGRLPGVKECFTRSRRYCGRTLGGYFCGLMAALGVVLATGVVMSIVTYLFVVMATALGPTASSVAGVTMSIVDPVVIFLSACGIIAISFIFVTPVCVLEGARAIASCDRTSQLVGRKRFWRTLGAVAALLLVTFGFELLLNFCIQSCLSVLHVTGAWDFIVSMAVDCGVAVLFAPYPFIVITLLYYDYRVRREGFDVQMISLELQAADAGGPQ